MTLLLLITGAAFEVLPFLGQSGQWWQKCEWEVADWLHLPPNCSSLPHYFLPFLPIISSHNCSIHLSPLNPPATQHSLFSVTRRSGSDLRQLVSQATYRDFSDVTLVSDDTC